MRVHGSAKAAILAAGLRQFDRDGFDQVTVASICAAAEASNGSFFHFFQSKRGLAAELFVNALSNYHAAMVSALSARPSAEQGVAALVDAHLSWVAESRREAKFVFEQARADWLVDIRREQQASNELFRTQIAAWADPLVAEGALKPMPAHLLVGQIIGPAQILCRAWLSGRDRTDPRIHRSLLADCAIRAVCNPKD